LGKKKLYAHSLKVAAKQKVAGDAMIFIKNVAFT